MSAIPSVSAPRPYQGDPNPAPQAATVGEVIEAYQVELALRRQLDQYAAKSLEGANHYLASFAAEYGTQPINRCATTDLTRWLLKNQQWKSDFTRNDAMARVITCFRWAEDERIIARTPYRRPKGLKLRLRPRKPIARCQTAALYQAMRHQSGRRRMQGADQIRRAVFFLRRTGARTCEMRAAEWRQLDWEAGVIRLEEHKTDHTGDDRQIGCDDAVLRMLRRLFKAARPGQKKIFVNSRGRPWTNPSFNRLFRAFVRRAGLPKGLSPYCLRHAWTVKGIEDGVPDRSLADGLGHKGNRYVSWYGRQTRQNSQHLRNVARQVACGKRAVKKRYKPEQPLLFAEEP